MMLVIYFRKYSVTVREQEFSLKAISAKHEDWSKSQAEILMMGWVKSELVKKFPVQVLCYVVLLCWRKKGQKNFSNIY